MCVFNLFGMFCANEQQLAILFVPTIENGEELCIRVFSFFQVFVFHAKSATAINDRTGLSDISY